MHVDSQYGFSVVSKQFVAELEATATLWVHNKTGAQLVSVQNADANKSFAISFPTLPTDNTGVAHILEHSVLNGSRKYPVKEPFVELMKSSVCSFLNAFTYPDKTVYPLASQNEEDFYNLIDVYLDAVFFPKLSQQTFQQEGWHHEPTETGWEYKGVVFNEMKGAGLSPDRCLWQATQAALFPDTPYLFDSGGDPSAIVKLTHEQFVQFHRDNYHPSQALVWMSGNDPEDRRLKTLAEYLDLFAARSESPVVIPMQDWHQSIVRTQGTFPAASADTAQTFATKNWVLSGAQDVQSHIELSVLEYLLIGTSTAPLRKALIDSGLGTDVAGGGIEFDLRQKVFSVGLRGVVAENASKVFDCIADTLTTLATVGFAADAVQAALTSIEFSLRENNSGSFPQGLSMGLRVLRGWVYGADPLALLPFESALAQVRASIESNPGYLQQLVTKMLIENQHVVELVLEPNPKLLEQQAALEKQQLDKFSAQLSATQDSKLRSAAKALQVAQQKPDSQKALATLPVLRLSDLSRQTQVVPTESLQLASFPGFIHELHTNGIVYLDLAWSIEQLTSRQLQMLPLFSTALTELGTKTFPEEKLQTAIDTRMGGLSTQIFVGQKIGSDEPVQQLLVRIKALPEQLPAVFELLRSLLVETSWENQTRFLQIVSEERAQFEASITDDGHRLVGSRLSSHLTPAGAVAELITGTSQLQFLQLLTPSITKGPALESELRIMAQALFTQPCYWNLTVSAADTKNTVEQLTRFFEQLPLSENGKPVAPAVRQVVEQPAAEALTMSSSVNFVGVATRLPLNGQFISASALVATQLLRTGYLWNTVRVQGGAYGAGVRIEPVSGIVVATSYRDPRLAETIAAFEGISQHLQTLKFSAAELEKAKIGTLGDIDQYKLPDAQGFSAYVQHMTGLTTELRQAFRDEVFATTLADLHALGTQLAEAGFVWRAAVTDPARAKEIGQNVLSTSLMASALQQE